MKERLIIEGKMSNSGSIHDIESAEGDRVIVFGKNCDYAVVLASYYGGRGYSTHDECNAIKKSKQLSKLGYSYQIIDKNGNYYDTHGMQLLKTDRCCKVSA